MSVIPACLAAITVLLASIRPSVWHVWMNTSSTPIISVSIVPLDVLCALILLVVAPAWRDSIWMPRVIASHVPMGLRPAPLHWSNLV